MEVDDIQLFEKQHDVYPAKVQGRYRRLKWAAIGALMAIYYIVPWIRWDRGPNAPDQAVLIDLPARRAWFFFIEIWPQEVYYLTGILILAAVGLFFVTSMFGRVWCGYACPQTVWTDLFVWAERLFQGDRNARMKLDKLPLWSFERIWKKVLTHALWIIIGLLTGGAWVMYFNDAPSLVRDAMAGHVSFNVALWVLGLTFSTYVMAGYAREQVCTYMCPYARFQSAMFDRDTLIIGYDSDRGEKRAPHKQGEGWEGRGHCVDCNRCVFVCPMGIDIRNGLQMQCIACGLCIDACNQVMDKVGLPRGLVRYDTEGDQEERRAARKAGLPFREHFRILRPRTFYYMAILLLVSGIMAAGLIVRGKMDLHVLHDRNPLLVRLTDGSVRNGYTIRILNKAHEKKTFELKADGLPKMLLKMHGAGGQTAESIEVKPDGAEEFRVMLAAPEESLPEQRYDITFTLIDKATGTSQDVKSMFITRTP